MYLDVLRSRALRIILVQIGSRQTDLLIQTLTTWDLTEVEILISDLTEILNPLRCVFSYFKITPIHLIITQIIYHKRDRRAVGPSARIPSLPRQLGNPHSGTGSPFLPSASSAQPDKEWYPD